MPYSLLKLLIESACADGHLSENDRAHLRKEADSLGVSQNNLEFMVNNELQRVKKIQQASEKRHETNNMSGFITNENTENDLPPGSGFILAEQQPTANNLKSGFITDKQQQKPKEQRVDDATFQDVKQLSSQGAMSIVSKGKYFGKWVTIKRLKPEFKDNDNYQRLFFKEFENAYHLDQQHIVRLLGKGRDANGLYYFMEYIDGRPLGKLISNRGVESGRLVKKIASEILLALDYVHKKQIYHRDLKPDNILITYKGDNVKLIDFGLAAADYFDDYLVKAGTPKYAAPEQQHTAHTVDGRSDIYSFGLIFLEMLTGQITDIEQVKQRSLMSLFIIQRCLKPDINQRYRYCSEVLHDLENIHIPDSFASVSTPPKRNESAEPTENTDKITQKPPEQTHQLHDYWRSAKQFFHFTHQHWLSAAPDQWLPPYSLEETFSSRAARMSAYELFISILEENELASIFDDFLFLKDEFLLTTDKKHLLATNYRLFLKTENAIQVFPLNDIDLKQEEVPVTEHFYVLFRNVKLWRSDWQLITKAIKAALWEKLDENNYPALSLKKANVPDRLQLAEQWPEFSVRINEMLFHVTVNELIEFTGDKWHSHEMIRFYNNYYHNHYPAIEQLQVTVSKIFKNYMPLKGEYFFLDVLHEKGLITNYRIFYQTYDNEIKTIPLSAVKSYSLQTGTGLFSSAKVKILTTSEKTIELEPGKNTLEQESEIPQKQQRINTLIAENTPLQINNTQQEYLQLTRSQTSLHWLK